MKIKIIIFFAIVFCLHIGRTQDNCVYMSNDIYPGSFGAQPAAMTLYNGALYFSATGNALGAELWKYENGTVSMVADINPGFFSSLPNEFRILGSDLYFSANNGTSGSELFKFDGTTVTLVADIVPGIGSSFVNKLTPIGGELYFFANDGVNGMEPWKYDGITVSMVSDINPGSASSNPLDIEGAGGNVFFTASHPSYGQELWKYDGVTTTVFDIYPGATGSDCGELTACGSKLVLRATDGVLGYELFVYDGVSLVNLNLNPAGDFTPWELTQVGSNVYFRGFTAANGYELWKYNGTAGSLVADIKPGTANSTPSNLTAVGPDELFFAASATGFGVELWHHNGASTVMAADIYPGSNSSMPGLGGEKFGVMGNTVFVVANNATSGNEVWRYNGSTAILGKDIIPGSGSPMPSGLIALGSKMFFLADDGIAGGELWVWDTLADLTETINVVTCGDYTSPAGNYYNSNGVYSFVDTLTSTICVGCDSLITVNLTIVQPDTSITVVACNDYTSPSGIYYNVIGNFTLTDVIPSVACPGVDSTITIDLTVIDNISTAVVVFTGVILAQQSGADYQWLDCDNGYAIIPGATDQDFLPSVDGNYACEVTVGTCSDTTNCYFVVANSGGINFEDSNDQNILMYPNPVNNELVIVAKNTTMLKLKIIDNLGNLVLETSSPNDRLEVNLDTLASGIYYAQIQMENSSVIRKFSKL